MITYEMIKEGFKAGIVQFVTDPNMGSGTVCKIGQSWFYFGGFTAEEESPESYLRNVPIEDVLRDVFTALNGFKNYGEYFEDEYLYYEYVLEESLKQNHDCQEAGTSEKSK
jgi:hypothetical protein